MNSSSEKFINSHSLMHPYSLEIHNNPINKYKSKNKNSNKMHINNRLYDHQRQKGNFKYLEKYVYKYFKSLYKNNKNDYNLRMIDDILDNESTHLVAEFKDYLIMGDFTEFLQKSYNLEECKKYLPKIYEYYNCCSVIFPNYVTLHESKYIYKSIRKKQKVIDNQQEQEDKKEKLKKGDIKLEENDEFFSSKTFNSILDQTNTSNVKLFFGINDSNNKDINETPNNIVKILEEAEKEAIQRKINLIKNNKKPVLNNNNKENSSINNISNLFIKNINSNNKIFIKNKITKEKNKNKENVHYLSTQKKANIQINNNNININTQNNKTKVRINSYLDKNNFKNENDNSKKNIKSSTNITDTDIEQNKLNNNYITFYENNFNHSKKKNTRKLFIGNSSTSPKMHQIYIKSGNHSNKNIKNQYINNSLFPTKNIFSKIFTNLNNNSVLKQNSFNFINKKIANKNIKEEKRNQYINCPGFTLSPSSNTIQGNPFRKKYKYHLNINIKESNSTRNIINHQKLNGNNKLNEKINVKNIQEKIKRNEKNQSSLNYNSNTISTTVASKTTTNKDRIKYIHINNNFNFNKAEIKNKFQNYNNFKTIFNSSRSNTNIINNINNNKACLKNNIKYNNINYNNNINYINNILIKDLNIHKINSTTDIKKPINMNININMNNNIKNKIYFNQGTNDNIINNKLYEKSPLSIELETIKVTSNKKSLYQRQKKIFQNKDKHSDLNRKFNFNKNNNNNNLSNDKNYLIDSLIHTSLNSNNQNDEIKNGFILEELNKKKNIILPFNKGINNINININGYNAHGGCLTSRVSNNAIKRKLKVNNRKDIHYYNQEFKMKQKNNNLQKNNNNDNIISKNENNPVKIKKIYDNYKYNKYLDTHKITGNLTSRKK